MYYLLEDNSIVDSNEYFKYAYAHKDGITYYNVTIKKQSENVFDLIDWNNDLVRVDDAIKHCKYFHRDLREEYIENKWFNAIYKPDEKGNYIKVWEVKEEDE